jgi:3-hydroxybutyryl-CoA dehydrogenase
MLKEFAIIGAGLMGRSISQAYALKNYRVRLYDNREPVRSTVKNLIDNDLALLVAEGLIDQAKKETTLNNIILVDKLSSAVADADFITEAIPEILALKQDFFQELENYTQDTAIIASNTSTLPIAELAQKMARPERFIITHFFNPAHLVPLVEIIHMAQTAPEVIDQTVSLMKALGKKPVVLKKDVPGFIANRLQAAILREALFLLNSGVAAAEDIDTAVTAGPGFRWPFLGPIATADFNGLDTWQRIMENLSPELDCSQSAPAILNRLVEQGKLGTKSGAGIYQYDAKATGSVAEQIKRRDTNLIRLLKILDIN